MLNYIASSDYSVGWLVGLLVLVYVSVNSLLITLFVNLLSELIYLHPVKWLQIFMSNTNNSI